MLHQHVLQYKILTAGTGAVPTKEQQVKVHYRGTTIYGTEFDSSYKRKEPATFLPTRVIKGWTEALQLMPVGSKWKLYIPSALAYGPRGAGANIGPNSTLEHNNIFHDFSSSGAGVNCGGNVKLGKFSFLGIGSSVKHKVNIENNCIIGGHSLVLRNCKKNSLYYGVPAEKKREWKFNDNYL